MPDELRRGDHSAGCACKPCIAWRKSLGMLGGEPVKLDSDHLPQVYGGSANLASEEGVVPKLVTTTYFDPAPYQELSIISQATGRPIAHFIREAVDQWLERRRKGRRTTLKPNPPKAGK